MAGIYYVTFQASVAEAAQLVIALNGIEQDTTVVGRNATNNQIVGMALIETTSANTLLSIRNPSAAAGSLSIDPNAGGGVGSPVSTHLVIIRVQ